MILDQDTYEFAQHYAIGLAGGGIPSVAMLAFALAEGDKESIAHAALVEGAVLGTQYAFLQAINYVSGPKYAMNFHKVHQGMNVVRGLAAGPALVLAVPTVIATATAVAYEEAVNKEIRQGRSGFDINWFGPFGSGFGSVV